jgi:hypothetical protein
MAICITGAADVVTGGSVEAATLKLIPSLEVIK